ncbi:hypothetical protein H6P81_013447 [Aristolochia fimbriata]|uniref:Uncharacterized protein n=1 Tax=Aristolochia fimbriata TaxID=158543 RepID=A0AAV7EF55_ARIFI|nr:hypothetical protein H6P81_013447 [Aristolochia fimbriata]
MAGIRPFFRSSASSPEILKTLAGIRTGSFSSHAPVPHRELPHEFAKSSDFLGSWERVEDPREAQGKLAMLRRDYKKQVKEIRKQYSYEVELQRQEKQRKDEAKKEKIRLEKEARKAEKAAVAKTRAAEREVAEAEFRTMLLKERAEKLEYWRAMEAKVEQKKKEKNDLLRNQSSKWISEKELDDKALEAVCDIRPL